MSGNKKVVDLFRPGSAATPEPKLSVAHLLQGRRTAEPIVGTQPVDLTGKRRLLFVVGAGNTGKAQPLDASVLTPLGFRPIGNLSVGDLITTPDGKIRPVTGVYPQGIKDIYRVTFHDGRSTECCDEHLWKVWLPKSRQEIGKTHATRRRIESGRWEIMSLRGLMDYVARTPDSPRGRRKLREIAIPMVAPGAIEFPPQELPIPPYTLGSLIGDGTISGGAIVFTTAEMFPLEKIIAEMPGYKYVPSHGALDCIDFRIQPIKQVKISVLRLALQSLGLYGCRSHEKFIPDIYKFSSASQRLAIIQGLMDTDGSLALTSACITTTSERLAKDIQEIVRSLGATASISQRQTTYTYIGVRKNGKKSWRVHITHPTPEVLFSSPKKLAGLKDRVKVRRLRLESIEHVGRKEAVCISVDHPDQLYVTDNFIVTHNTKFLRWACERALGRENRGEFALATADAMNRDLVEYFEDVMEAPVEGSGQWLSQFMSWIMAGQGSGAINFGGTDTSLAMLSQEIPDLPAVLAASGVEAVLLAFLSPRIADLTAYQVLDESGFRPAATALVCNLGTMQGADARAFDDVTGHSIFRGAMARGAAHVWMPRLHSAGPSIERARSSFAKAMDGGAKRPLLDILGRARLAVWMKEMEAAFAPVASWLP